MKRIFVSAAFILASIAIKAQAPQDTSALSHKIKIEEINFVSSYYNQNGDNAAVTGGIGSQKLTDIANVLEVKLIKYDKKYRKHTLDGEIGIDHYTSASSDKIDLKANSSASSADTRIYPSLTWTIENEKKGTTIGIGASSSTEYDYQSFGGKLLFNKTTKNKNTDFGLQVQAFMDQVKLITPTELRTGGGREDDDYGSSPRNSYSASWNISHIVNKNMQVMLLGDVIKQDGFLSLPFHRVYFADNSVHQENLPSSRLKIPVAGRLNYFFGSKVIARTYYRYYKDDWGITSHTINIETPYKINSFFSVTPYYRYYTQTAADYFQPYKIHTATNKFYTSNYDLSKFSSQFFGVGFRTAPVKGVLGNHHIKSLEVRGGHYSKSYNMNANIISLHFQFI